MNRSKGSNTFYCFSPGVMLATLIIEVVYIVYILLRYKSSPLTRIGIAILFFLAMFQLAEYIICEGPASATEWWARAGFISITLLPPLGIHFIHTIARRKWNKITAVAYGTALAWAAIIAFVPNVFSAHHCGGNYAIISFQNLGIPYFMYYYFWLYAGTLLALKFAFDKSNPKPQVKQSLLLYMLAYLILLVPTAAVNMTHPETLKGIPSIMCGFAIFMASVIVFFIIPKLGSRKDFK